MQKLTNKELQVMEAFWESEKPLTTVDLFKSHIEEKWTRNYVQNTVTKLINKEFIEQCGMARCNTQYARMFRPRITREEYSSMLMSDLKVPPDKLTKIVIHFAKKNNQVSRKSIITQLEDALIMLRRVND